MKKSVSQYEVIFPDNPYFIPDERDVKTTGFEVDLGGLTPTEAIAQEAAKLKLERYLYSCWKANHIEADPEKTLTLAREDIKEAVRRKNGAQRFFQEWDRILAKWTVKQICALLRDNTDDTEQLRLCAPFCGKIPDAEIDKIHDQVYGAAVS